MSGPTRLRPEGCVGPRLRATDTLPLARPGWPEEVAK